MILVFCRYDFLPNYCQAVSLKYLYPNTAFEQTPVPTLLRYCCVAVSIVACLVTLKTGGPRVQLRERLTAPPAPGKLEGGHDVSMSAFRGLVWF